MTCIQNGPVLLVKLTMWHCELLDLVTRTKLRLPYASCPRYATLSSLGRSRLALFGMPQIRRFLMLNLAVLLCALVGLLFASLSYFICFVSRLTEHIHNTSGRRRFNSSTHLSYCVTLIKYNYSVQPSLYPVCCAASRLNEFVSPKIQITGR